MVELGIHDPVTDAQRDALARTQKSQKHLHSLINDVLNLAKLEAGHVEYDREDVPLSDVLTEVLSMIEPQFEAKGLACEARVPSEVVAHGDREKVRQILINLLSNSIKFTGRGGRVTVDSPWRANAPLGLVFLRVSDTGIGIAREKQEAIFDPFVQVHRNLTSVIEGTGLGLSISRDLARGMGGDLRVRSAGARGSTFTLALPRGANPLFVRPLAERD